MEIENRLQQFARYFGVSYEEVKRLYDREVDDQIEVSGEGDEWRASNNVKELLKARYGKTR